MMLSRTCSKERWCSFSFLFTDSHVAKLEQYQGLWCKCFPSFRCSSCQQGLELYALVSFLRMANCFVVLITAKMYRMMMHQLLPLCYYEEDKVYRNFCRPSLLHFLVMYYAENTTLLWAMHACELMTKGLSELRSYQVVGTIAGWWWNSLRSGFECPLAPGKELLMLNLTAIGRCHTCKNDLEWAGYTLWELFTTHNVYQTLNWWNLGNGRKY
jgi:hypothetical protein